MGRALRRRAAAASWMAGALLVWLAAPGEIRAEDVSVSATVDSREIPVGETLSYTVQVRGAGMSGVSPSAPSSLTNLQLVGGPRTSTQFSFVNGVVSSSKSYTWFLAPQAPGKARIGATEVKIGDKVYRTESIDVDVTPAGTGRSPRAEPDGQGAPPARGRDISAADMRIENELSAQQLYVGQPLVLTTRLLTRVPVVDVSAGADPTVPGFILEESDTNVVPERVFREGREYQSYVLGRRILTPTTPGKTVIPAETRTIRIRASSRDIFDSFFAPRVAEVQRSTVPVTIEALAPPAAGRPANFTGAVGSFRMEATADRDAAAVGEAVGLKVTLTGTGNLKTVESPSFSPGADFRIFDPRIEESATGVKPRTYTKTWSYVVTPLSSGDLVIPEVSFNYFDPEAKSYKTLSSKTMKLAVKKAPPGGLEGGPAVATTRHEVQSLQRDIRFLKPLDSPLLRARQVWYARWWLWGVVAIAVLVQPAAWFVKRRGGLSALAPGGARGRSRRRAMAEIARARSNGTGERVGESNAASRAILGYIGDRCRVAPTGLTYEELEAELARRGVAPPTRQELRGFLERCDLLRFAPEAPGREGAHELLDRARSLVERLDAEIGSAA